MPWPSSLSQRPSGTSANDGKANNSPPPLKTSLDAKEDPTNHEVLPPTPTSPTYPDRRFSFVSPIPPSSSTATDTKSSSSPKILTEEALIALTSKPLSHGGAWSSVLPNKKTEDKPQEEVYTGVGEHPSLKTASELARARQAFLSRKHRIDKYYRPLETKKEREDREAEWVGKMRKIKGASCVGV